MHKKTIFVIVGGLVAVGLAAALIVGLVAPSPVEAYKGKDTVQIKSAALDKRSNGECYVTVTWDKNAGRPRFYMLERQGPDVVTEHGVLPGAVSIDAPQRLSPAQVRAGSLVIGPLPSAEIGQCRIALAPSLRGKKAVWVWTDFLR